MPSSKPLLILCADPFTMKLAQEISEVLQEEVEIGEIRWGKFEYNFSNTRVMTDVYGRDVLFLASFWDQHAIQDQLDVLFSIPRTGARSLRVFLPFFPGTMDRIRRPGEVATAMTFARQLSSIPHCRGNGMAEIVIVDIHQTAEQFYFSDDVLVTLKSSMRTLRAKILADSERERISICFPDDGARKRFEDAFDGIPQIVCAKARPDGLNARVVVMDGTAKGRKVWIVDDQVRGGTTLCDTARAVREQGATWVGGFVPHYCAPNLPEYNAGDGVGMPVDQLIRKAGFDRLIVTNSHPASESLRLHAPWAEVLSLAPLLLSVIAED